MGRPDYTLFVLQTIIEHPIDSGILITTTDAKGMFHCHTRESNARFALKEFTIIIARDKSGSVKP